MASTVFLPLLLAMISSLTWAVQDDVWSTLAECSTAPQLASCLQIKLAAGLETASVARTLDLGPVTLTRDASLPSRAARSEKQLEESLPAASEERERALDDLVLDRAAGLFQSHSLKINVDQLAPKEEGRGKRRRTLAALMMMLMMIAGTLIPIKLGTLALLAGKALIISKLALALALIVGLKKLISSGEDHESSYQVVHGHRRDLDSHDLAYSAYTQ